jgi:hypothetical protein
MKPSLRREQEATGEGGEVLLSTPCCWSAPISSCARPPSLKVERSCSSLEEKAWLTEYAPRMPWTSEEDEEEEEDREEQAWHSQRTYRYHIPPCFSPSIVAIHRAPPPLTFPHEGEEEEEETKEDDQLRILDWHRAPCMPITLPDDDAVDRAPSPPLRLPDASLRMRRHQFPPDNQ